jgi:hypothetical protein
MKRPWLILIIIVITGTLHSLSAQFNDIYQNETIYLQNSTYIKGGIKYPLGFFHSRLKKEMQISPDAMLEFRKYERKRNAFIATYAVGSALLISNVFVKSANTQRVLLGAGIGVMVISLPFSIQSGNHLQKAVWIRNGDVLE